MAALLATASERQRKRIAQRIGMSTSALASRDAQDLAPWLRRAIADALELPEDELFRGGRR